MRTWTLQLDTIFLVDRKTAQTHQDVAQVQEQFLTFRAQATAYDQDSRRSVAELNAKVIMLQAQITELCMKRDSRSDCIDVPEIHRCCFFDLCSHRHNRPQVIYGRYGRII